MESSLAKSVGAETIAAISTPPGRGGIGVVRLAGQDALRIVATLVRLHRPLEHARARFTEVLETRGAGPAGDGLTNDGAAALDQAVVTAYFAPHSYTGDDVVEISTHGSPVILSAVLEAALQRGARLAEPGEFTRRAFLAGKLDLTQAEAVHDLIAAQTLEQARAAAQQLGGALSRRVAPAKEELLHLIALLEAGMDFASGELDDVDVTPPATILQVLQRVEEPLRELAGSFRSGALLREGASLALVGRPNAGKSSLFNRLLERPRAIVTPVPGTTRDTVEESWSLGGIPVRLVDTAGLRLGREEPADEAERQGIARSREALAEADLVLLVHDATAPLAPEERAMVEQLAGRPFVLVANKIDLLSPEAMTGNDESTAYAEALRLSALTGEGLASLRSVLLQRLNAAGDLLQAGALNNRRQQQAVLDALAGVNAAKEAVHHGLPHELLLVDLHHSLRALDGLTGVTTADDVLERIFSTFCIGK